MIELRGVLLVLASLLVLVYARVSLDISASSGRLLILVPNLVTLGIFGIAFYKFYFTLKEQTKLAYNEIIEAGFLLFALTLLPLVAVFGPGDNIDNPFIEWPLRLAILLATYIPFKRLTNYIQLNKARSEVPEVSPAPEPIPETTPPADIEINLKNRFEHTHILGGTGSGKTQLIQYLISKDLGDDCTIIVIDNQRQMINKLARLGQEMALISPRYPLALNLFARPRADTTVSLLKYVMAGLMESPLTPKQELIFEFGIQLMLVTPRATINTFRQLLDAHQPDLTYVSRLDNIGREFFETQFMDRSFDQTKKEISWRIWSLLKNPTLAEMFTAETNKVNITRELHRKLILIDTDIDKLQEYSGFFGRFFIAQLLEAAQARFVGQHRPVYVYIDEAYYYFDQNIASMLETARKAKIGLIMAHQYLGQITEPKMRDAIMSLTSTKFASSLSPSDAHSMAQAMHTHVDNINRQRKLQFALWQRGEGAIQEVGVPTGIIESYPTYPIPDELMRNRYARSENESPIVVEEPKKPEQPFPVRGMPRKPPV